MLNKNKFMLSLVLLLSFVTFTGTITVNAKNDADLPKKFIEDLAEKMITNITSNSNDKVSKFRAMFVENLDMEAISRFVLSTHWRTISEEKRKDFIESFTEASVLTWSGRFDEYKGEKIIFHNSTPAPSPNQFFVKSTIDFIDTKDVEVIWRLQQKGKTFKIIDIIVEGVSMAMTYRNEYGSIIQNSNKGIDGLIESLKTKINEYNGN